MKHLIFVYGSLKTGQRLNHLLKDCRKIRNFTTGPTHTLYSLGWYPGLKKEGNTAVKGEIWEVTTEIFQYLDGMEKAAGYKREHLLDQTGEELIGEIWYWLYRGKTTPDMACGDNWSWPPKKDQSQHHESPAAEKEVKNPDYGQQSPSSSTSDPALKHQQAFAKGL